MGKSFIVENIIGRFLEDQPGPIIYYGPTAKNIAKKVEPVIQSMINQSPNLRPMFDRKRSNQFLKQVGASRLYLANAGSSAETSATSAHLVLIDELDRCDRNSDGSLVELAESRLDAYPDSRLGITATPTYGRVERYTHKVTGLQHWQVAKTDAVRSATWREWQDGTRHEWAIPCPDCDQYFIPWSGLLDWPNKGTDEIPNPHDAEKFATLACPNCDHKITDKFRQSMNTKGIYVAPGQSVKPDGTVTGDAETAGNSHFSYWCSGLCSFSAKKSYGYLAKKLIMAESKGDPDVLLPVYNTGFGECFSLCGDAPAWEEVKAMAWKYHTNELIAKPEMILCSVDVHKRRLNYVIRAWFLGMGSALLDAGELFGDTSQPEIWAELTDFYSREWCGFEIDEIGIDCGYRDDIVYDFVKKNRGRARALRGAALQKPYRAIKLDIDGQGKARKTGTTRWDFNSPGAKAWVHSRVGWDKKKPAFWILPADINDDYCRQIVGEEFDERQGGWVQTGENHFLDCEAMNVMLARMRGLKRKKGGFLLSQIVEGSKPQAFEEETTEATTEETTTPAETPKVKDSWLGDTGGGWF